MHQKLSVIIPLYQQADSIVATLDSLAAQNLELDIIVVDDASTDGGGHVVEDWAKTHNIAVRLITNQTRSHALACRLKGVTVARSQAIMFVDADDVLLGKDRLQIALQVMHDSACEIVHFRTREMDPSGVIGGEFLSNAPLSLTKLVGKDVFSHYVAQDYPPVLIWGKIYSKELIERVLPIAASEHLIRLDDKFLVSLLMLHAHSYIGCDEYIYRYTLSDNWTMEKYAERVHDLFIINKVMTQLMNLHSVRPEDVEKFNQFVGKRITVNLGKFCIEVEKKFFNGTTTPESFSSYLETLFDDTTFFGLALFSSCNNVDTILRFLTRIRTAF